MSLVGILQHNFNISHVAFSFSIEWEVVGVHTQSLMFRQRSKSVLNLDHTTTCWADRHPGPPPLQYIDEHPKITDNDVHLVVLMQTCRKEEHRLGQRSFVYGIDYVFTYLLVCDICTPVSFRSASAEDLIPNPSIF